MPEKRGKLIVVSGPSGAGKSTVIQKLMERRSDLCFSVSATTRDPREGEVQGKDYFFVSHEAFDEMVERGELLEHATYVKNCYGTPRNYVEQRRAEGLHVLLDIEVQGAAQVRAKVSDAVTVFVIPPSLEVLRQRLHDRGTDSELVIQERLERARAEYVEAAFYDYIVVNDDADAAAKELDAIITAACCRFEDRKEYLKIH